MTKKGIGGKAPEAGANPKIQMGESTKRATSTSDFGVGRRESHDASDFYARFTPPILSDDETVNASGPLDWIHHGDAREMDVHGELIRPNSVALVVTSPPYFAGKAYETDLGVGHVPADYIDYLAMLRDVFSKCAEKLEPGGRIAINVANLGRKPYRSLATDVVRILQDDLGLLLRGEIIWRKAEGATGSCAWGSFQSASNPVLRDLTERVIVASKGRFDRAIEPKRRAKLGLPFESTIFKDDFMDWTTDVWNIGSESAVRVGHPAPFPVELPQRLIELYTYKGDVVLDPFMGSGSSAVAALRSRRHYIGFDTDADYIRQARERLDQAVHDESGTDTPAADSQNLAVQAVANGWMLKELALKLLVAAGFAIERLNAKGEAKPVRLRHGVDVSFVARDQTGSLWYFDVAGALTRGSDRAGLGPSDVLFKALAKATILQGAQAEAHSFVLLTAGLPSKSTSAAGALRASRGPDRPVFDVVELLAPESHKKLASYAERGPSVGPIGELYPATARSSSTRKARVPKALDSGASKLF